MFSVLGMGSREHLTSESTRGEQEYEQELKFLWASASQVLTEMVGYPLGDCLQLFFQNFGVDNV